MTKKFLKTMLLAAAGLTILASAGKAQVTYNNANGDFLLGFRQVGSTNSVLLDIGPITDFTIAQSWSLGNLGSVLASTFGSGWATDANVFFSLAATTRPGDSTRTNYVTSPGYLSSAFSVTVWNRLTSTNSLTLQNKIIAMGNQYNDATLQAQQTPGNRAEVEPNSLANAYANYHPGGTNDAGHASGNISYGFFNPTVEGNFGEGTAGVHLDLIQLVPGSGPGVDLGYFTLSADGSTLFFTPVPEPSTYAMMGLGMIGLTGLVILKRRRQVRA